MVRNHMRFGAVALLLCALTLPVMALAGVSYSTFPASGSNGASCIGQDRSNAVGVQIPAGSDYTLNTVAMRFYGTGIGQTPFSLDVYDDNAGVPGSSVGALINTGSGLLVYTFAPVTPITLQAGEVYWVTASSSAPGSCVLSWAFTPNDPAGSVFSLVGEKAFDGASWADLTSPNYLALEINADPAYEAAPAVPIPAFSLWGMLLTAMGVVVIAGFSRRLGREETG